MKTNDVNFEKNTYRSREIRKNVVNSNFTREDYIEPFYVINYLIKQISDDSTGCISKYPFIVVWQRHE